MKKHLFALAVVPLCSGLAHADNVSIYGIIDTGISYFSNVANSSGGKSSLVKVDTGVSQGSRIGFKGNEDLGGGMSAFFTLETGFNEDDGSLGQGGLIFGRQSFVGLSDKTLGSVSLGRQYDFMANIGAQYAMGAMSPAGSLAWGLHADAAGGGVLNDHVYAGDRTNNSVKYNSASFSGASFGVMYGLGEVAGNNSAGRTVSARGSYDAGPFSTTAAYTDIKNATGTAASRIYGIGASYQLGPWKPFGLVTQVKATGTSLKDTTYELGAVYSLTAAVDLSAAYELQSRNQDIGNAQQVIAMVDYKLSKRTDLYAGGVYNRDKGYKSFPMAGGGVQSTTGVQSILRVGMRHVF